MTRQSNPEIKAVTEQDGDMTTRRALVVLGAHRSGTSALTRVLNLLGVDLAADLDPPNAFNETGYWEPRRLQAMNESVLRAYGSRWDDWRHLDPAGLDPAERSGLVREAVDMLTEDYHGSRLFTLKDPRLCRLMGFWDRVFTETGITPAFVLPVRAPDEVACSLTHRDGSSHIRGITIWLRNMLDAEAATRGRPRIFTTYDQLLTDWRETLHRIGAALDLVWPCDIDTAAPAIDAFLDARHRHFRIAGPDAQDSALRQLALEAYAALGQLCNDGPETEACSALDRIAEKLEQASGKLCPGSSSAAEPPALDQLSDTLAALADDRSDTTALATALGIVALEDLGSASMHTAEAAEQREEQARRREEQARLKAAATERHEKQARQKAEARQEKLATQVAAVIRTLRVLDEDLLQLAQRTRKTTKRPINTLLRTWNYKMLRELSKVPVFPERRRARFAKSAAKRDPKNLGNALVATSKKLRGQLANPALQSLEETDAVANCELRVTAIVPNYNHAAFLAKRLDSILNQTYPNIDVIVLDDMSQDNSREVIETYAARHPGRFRTIFNTENSGNVFRQWRRGVEAADGDLVWICESDDFCAPDFVQQLITAFLDPSVMIAFGRIQFVNTDGSLRHGLDTYRESAEPGIWNERLTRPACAWFTNGFGVRNVIANVGGALWRRTALPDAVWQTAETFRVAGDWYLYSEIANGGQIAYRPHADAAFRIHHGNTSVMALQSPDYYEEYMSVMTALRKRWPIPEETINRFIEVARSVFDAQPESADLGQFEHFVNAAELQCEARPRPHILIAFLGFRFGGGELFPINLANALKVKGYTVSMLALLQEDSHPDVQAMLDPGIAVYEASSVRKMGLEVFLRTAGVSIIHSHICMAEFFFFETLTEPLKIPYVVTLHGSYEAMEVDSDRICKAGRNVSHWVYTTERNLKPLAPLKLSPERITKMRNGMPIDPQPFPLDKAAMGIAEDTVVFALSRAA